MITVPDADYEDLRKGTDWIQKHIFPGSLLLSTGRVNQAINRTGQMFLHAHEDLGSGYARTLREWHVKFNAVLDKVRSQGFSEAFIRKWNYYLKVLRGRLCHAQHQRRASLLHQDWQPAPAP